MPAIVVTARDSRITASQRRYLGDKLIGLGKYFDGINKVEAVLEQSATLVDLSLRISVPGGRLLVCSARGKKIYQVVNLACARAEDARASCSRCRDAAHRQLFQQFEQAKKP